MCLDNYPASSVLCLRKVPLDSLVTYINCKLLLFSLLPTPPPPPPFSRGPLSVPDYDTGMCPQSFQTESLRFKVLYPPPQPQLPPRLRAPVCISIENFINLPKLGRRTQSSKHAGCIELSGPGEDVVPPPPQCRAGNRGTTDKGSALLPARTCFSHNCGGWGRGAVVERATRSSFKIAVNDHSLPT